MMGARGKRRQRKDGTTADGRTQHKPKSLVGGLSPVSLREITAFHDELKDIPADASDSIVKDRANIVAERMGGELVRHREVMARYVALYATLSELDDQLYDENRFIDDGGRVIPVVLAAAAMHPLYDDFVFNSNSFIELVELLEKEDLAELPSMVDDYVIAWEAGEL